MIRNWSGWLYLFPHRVVRPESIPDDFDLAQWSKYDYDWKNDPFFGLKDVIKPVDETIESGEGDCDDYAAVVASVLSKRGEEFTVHVCWRWWRPLFHMFVTDGDVIYSSGQIVDKSVDEYVAESVYDEVI